MKNNFAISYSLLLLFLSFGFGATSQTEPRLVLPIGQKFPNVQKRVKEYFSSNERGDNLVFSKNLEKAYHAQGFYILLNGEVQISFDLLRGNDLIAEGIELPLSKYPSEQALIESITQSIAIEIKKIQWTNESSKLRN